MLLNVASLLHSQNAEGHGVDGSAVKVPSDIGGSWQSVGHHFLENA